MSSFLLQNQYLRKFKRAKTDQEVIKFIDKCYSDGYEDGYKDGSMPREDKNDNKLG